MSLLQSTIIYGVEVSDEFGEIDYANASIVNKIAEKHSLTAVWSGRDGEPPSSIVVGVTLNSYNEEGEGMYINLKELLEKEEKAKEGFPANEVMSDIEEQLGNILQVSGPFTIIQHADS